jgi:outer membrane protein
MTEDQRQRTEKELRDSYRDLSRKQQEVQDDFNARRNEEMSRLQKILIEEVRVYAKAQNFDLVIADGVIYSTPTLDITPAILTALQSHAPAAKTSGPAAPAPKPQGK